MKEKIYRKKNNFPGIVGVSPANNALIIELIKKPFHYFYLKKISFEIKDFLDSNIVVGF
jgi:hypothetical protein